MQERIIDLEKLIFNPRDRRANTHSICVQRYQKKVRAFVVIAILLVALPELLYVAFRSKTVQTVAVRWLMEQVGQTFNTRIKVGGIDISFFDHVTLEKIVIEDQSRDTLVYIDQLKLEIDSIRYGSRRVHLNNIIVQQPRIRLFQDTTGTNFQFILDSLKSFSSYPKRFTLGCNF